MGSQIYTFIQPKILFIGLVIYSLELSAGFLSIRGNPSFEVNLQGDTIKITGEIRLTNSGDEDAVDVFPEISIGKLHYTGDPKRLRPNDDHHTWSFELTSNINNLSDDNLSKFGRWPVFVTRHYSDVNGHPFSAVDVFDIILSKNNMKENFFNEIPFAINIRIGKRKKFKVKASITNKTDRFYKTTLRIHAAKEFLFPEAKQISISSKQSIETEFNIKNIKGSKGSKYPIFVVMEYEDHGFRNFRSTYKTYNVARNHFNMVWIIFSIISGLVMVASILYLLKNGDNS